MLSSSFDITILGTDLPALIFGALAAKKNYRVLVIGQGGHDNIYDINGFKFVSHAQLIYGLHSSTFISDCFGDLALGPEIRNRPLPMDPIAQVVMPGIRLDLPVSTDVFDRELKREFPNVAEKISGLMAQDLQSINKSFQEELDDFPILPPRSIRDSMSHRSLGNNLDEVVAPFSKEFADLAHNPNAVAALNAMASGLALFPMQPGGIAQSRLLWHLRNGLVHIDWGMDEIRRIFLERIKQNAGEVRLKENADSIETDWRGNIKKLTLKRSGDEIGTSMLIMGMDPHGVLDLLPPGRKTNGLREDLMEFKASHYLFTLNLGMDAAQVPDAMARVVFNVLDPHKPLEGDNFLIIQKNSAMEPISGQNSMNRAVITVSAFMPAKKFDNTVSSWTDFGDLVMDALCRDVMPFLDVDQTTQSIAAIRKKTGEDTLFIDPRSLMPIYQDDKKKGLDLFAIPVHTRYKNLLNLGAEVQGSLGFEGAFYAAREALKLTRGLIKIRGVT